MSGPPNDEGAAPMQSQCRDAAPHEIDSTLGNLAEPASGSNQTVACLQPNPEKLTAADVAALVRGEDAMSASHRELLAALEAARDSYANTHCAGDATTAYSKVAEIVLSLQPDFGAVTLPKLSCKPKLAASALGKLQQLMRTRRPAGQSVLNLRMTPSGVVIPDEENVLRILTNDPNLQDVVRFDEFIGDMILTRPITADSSVVAERGIPRLWADADTVTLQTYIQRFIVPRMGRDKIEAVVAMHARHNCAFHPVRDYLQSLSWDGVPRLNTCLRDSFGAKAQPEKYLAAVGAAWCISAVARIFEPGCQVDSALVLEGPQGFYKSTALRVLAGDAYFSDSLSADLSHKDARDHLRGKWIIELAELAQFKRAEIETVKQFVTRRFEQYRPSYGRHEIKFPRQCVFAGSTNDETYLVDTTGNRRFWVVACGRIDIDALKRDRDQLWAEAVTRYRAGERWHLTGELEALAAAEALLRVAHDPWTANVAEVLAYISTPDVSPGEVMARMNLREGERHARNAGRIGQILKDLGWRKGHRDRTRGQTYTPPPGWRDEGSEKRRKANDQAFAEPPAAAPRQPKSAPAVSVVAERAPVWDEDELAAAAQPEKANRAAHEEPTDPRKMFMERLPTGPKTADDLVRAGFSTFEQIVCADPAVLIAAKPTLTAEGVMELKRRATAARAQQQKSFR